ncbi:MAG: FkbM family methyltransferase [Chloroflexi bacterium]|nr:FkbM family methyltransferase [Chloroflexota bacterium]
MKKNMLRQLWKRFKQIVIPARIVSGYSWKSVQSGVFAGLTLYLPIEWGEEVIHGQYEQEFLGVIQSIAPRGGVLYDVGAHYGLFTAAWLHCGGRFVESFEPLAENRNILNQMLTYNHWEDKVHIHSIAIGRHTGSDWLIAYPGDSSRTFVPQVEEIHAVPAGTLKSKISIWTLTDLVYERQLENPDLIKIDVEGLEGDVVEGAMAFLSDKKPPVMVEVHSTLNGLRTADQLGKLGYEMHVLGLKGKKKSLPLALWIHPETHLLNDLN